MKKIYIIIFIILFLFIFFLLYKDNYEKTITKNLFYMDTYIEVKLYINDTKKANRTLIEIDNIYKDYHKLTSRYEKFSSIKNVYYINEILKPNEYVKLDKRLMDIINYSIEYYYKTEGLFNVALGNVIEKWKNYRDDKIGIPTYIELKTSGSNNIEDIVIIDNKIMKKSDVKLDLGAIAKGYTTQLVGEYLESIGVNKYLINAGGNVKVGKHYSDSKYKIGIENPNNKEDIHQIIKGENISVVTSGSYNRYYIYNDKKYHHIIDPKTYFPPYNMESVTIVTSNSAYADVISTYMFLISIEDGIKYIDSLADVEAIWYDINNKIYKSKGFNKYE